MNNDYIDLTKDVTVEKFKTIAAVILKEGDRKPYCNKYNNSPHYKADSLDIYLNPVSQFTNWSADELSFEVSDYNVIVIQDFNSTVVYYDLILKDGSVLLRYNDLGNKKVIIETFLKKYLPAIEKAFHLK